MTGNTEGFGKARSAYRLILGAPLNGAGEAPGPHATPTVHASMQDPDVLYFSLKRKFSMKDFLRVREEAFLDCLHVGLLRRPLSPLEYSTHWRDTYPKSYRMWLVVSIYDFEERRQRGTILKQAWFWRIVVRNVERLYPIVLQFRRLRMR